MELYTQIDQLTNTCKKKIDKVKHTTIKAAVHNFNLTEVNTNFMLMRCLVNNNVV